jgi:cytochrome c
MARFIISVAFAAFSVTAASARTGDDDEGQLAFNNHCRTCHTMKEGDNRLGPSLLGIVGRKAGSLNDFAYSPAMANASFHWDEKTLDQFIANPDSVVSGNSMKPYTALADAEERAKIIKFLAQQN